LSSSLNDLGKIESIILKGANRDVQPRQQRLDAKAGLNGRQKKVKKDRINGGAAAEENKSSGRGKKSGQLRYGRKHEKI